MMVQWAHLPAFWILVPLVLAALFSFLEDALEPTASSVGCPAPGKIF